jgi:hypothetical protein
VRETFNRRIVQQATADGGVSLVFAVPDHPWVDNANGAAVRIAMTVAAPGRNDGRICSVKNELEGDFGEVAVSLTERRGYIHPDLSVGANVAGARRLQANTDLSNRGVQLFGAGFIVSRSEAVALGLGALPELDRHIRK